MGFLYTIGHSHHEPDYFLRLLRKYDINYVLDVRSTPYSKFAPQFNAETINAFLSKRNINYVQMGNFFGARPKDLELYTPEGYLDFNKTRNTVDFKKAVNNVLLGMNKGNNIALMCTEKNPIECHRTILVSKAFYDLNIPVKHILSNGTLRTQDSINEELLDMYFPERNQLNLFNFQNDSPNEKDLIEKSYYLRNRDIGYHINTPTFEEENI